MRYSFNQAAYELLDLYRTKLKKSEDLDLREIKRWVRTKRSLWLRNEYNKNRVIDDACEQDLGAVNMQYVSDNFKVLTSGTAVKALFTLSSTTVLYYADNEVTPATVTDIIPIGQKLIITGIIYTLVTSTVDGFTIDTPYTGTTDYLTLSELRTPLLLSDRVIPTAVELYDRPAITRIGPVNKAQYNYLPIVPLSRLPFLRINRFTLNSIYSFQWNNKIGVSGGATNNNISDIFTNGLNIIGVFEDPIEAGRFPEKGDTVGLTNGYSTTKYYDDDTEGPIHDWMFEYMKSELVKMEGTIAHQITKENESSS
jgi:hypothetical protein